MAKQLSKLHIASSITILTLSACAILFAFYYKIPKLNSCIAIHKYCNRLILLGAILLSLSIIQLVITPLLKPCLIRVYAAFGLLLSSAILYWWITVTRYVIGGLQHLDMAFSPLPSYPVANMSYVEYHLSDFARGKLYDDVSDSKKWETMYDCVKLVANCSDLGQRYRIATDFYKAPLSPLQSGCCRPPSACNFAYGGPTFVFFDNPHYDADPDCLTWSNNQTQLCLSCDSCKAGLVVTVNKQILVPLIALGAVPVILISCYVWLLWASFSSNKDQVKWPSNVDR